jgi:PAS domain S-box-containing protein
MEEIVGPKKQNGVSAVAKSVQLGFASIIALLIVSAAVSYFNTCQLFDNQGRVARNHQIQGSLGDVLSTMKDVETSQRGYVITGGKEFLEPYRSATTHIQPQIERLRELLAESAEQQSNLAVLEKKIGARLDLSKQSNLLRETEGFKAAQDFAATGQGKQAIYEVHNQIEEMQRAELISLRRREGQCAQSFYVAVAADLLTALLGIGLVAVAFRLVKRDITARVLAEDALRAARGRFRSVVDHVIHGIISFDEAGLIESVNPAAERLFGYPAAEIIGQNINRLMREPHQSEQDIDPADYLLADHAKIIGTRRERVGLRKDGTTFPMELAVSTFPLGKRRLFTGIVQDITERKGMEEELRQRVAELKDADRRKNEFLAMLAHELRNPLAPVHNAVQLLRKNCPADDETKWAHDVIERQVQHMRRMVDNLLDVSRITRGKINLQKEPIDVADVVMRAVEMVQPLIEARKHELTISLPPQPLRLEADLPRLAQVLANLLNNAAKYTEEGGHIWLTVEAQEGEVLLKVRDTGIGIPADYLPHVFDLFSQEDTSLERSQGGLGIGLTLARILVKMHGGVIRVSSAGTGQGSEFVVRLPGLADLASPPQSTPSVEAPPVIFRTRRILVVDDNVDGAATLSILLKQAGHEVQTAHNGMTALEIARQWPPQIVLLDIAMPQMSGLEVARRLRGDLGLTDVMLVAMTGFGQDEDRHRSQEAGFNAHMVKPLDLDALAILLARPEADPSIQSQKD